MVCNFQSGKHSRKLIDADAEAPHPSIDFQVHRMPRHAQPGRRPVQRLDMPGFPNRGSQVQPDNLSLLASPEASHQKNVGADASLAQWNRLIERSHTEPLRPFSLQRARALDCAVTVSVSLHNAPDG